jgi:hypothetical protein
MMTYQVRLINIVEPINQTIKYEFLDWLKDLGLIYLVDYEWNWIRIPDAKIIGFDVRFNDPNIAILCKLTWG